MLETGTGPGMAEAHRLYARAASAARPFLDYPASQWSAFFEKHIGQPAVA